MQAWQWGQNFYDLVKHFLKNMKSKKAFLILSLFHKDELNDCMPTLCSGNWDFLRKPPHGPEPQIKQTSVEYI